MSDEGNGTEPQREAAGESPPRADHRAGAGEGTEPGSAADHRSRAAYRRRLPPHRPLSRSPAPAPGGASLGGVKRALVPAISLLLLAVATTAWAGRGSTTRVT